MQMKLSLSYQTLFSPLTEETPTDMNELSEEDSIMMNFTGLGEPLFHLRGAPLLLFRCFFVGDSLPG